MTDGLVANGTVIQRGDGATPEVFTTIAEIFDYDGPGGAASVIDMTHLLSSAMEKKIGLPDEGQFTFNMNYIPSDAMQQALRQDRRDAVARNFKVVLPDIGNQVWAFTAFVLNFSISGAVNEKIPASVTLEITGLVDVS